MHWEPQITDPILHHNGFLDWKPASENAEKAEKSTDEAGKKPEKSLKSEKKAKNAAKKNEESVKKEAPAKQSDDRSENYIQQPQGHNESPAEESKLLEPKTSNGVALDPIQSDDVGSQHTKKFVRMREV